MMNRTRTSSLLMLLSCVAALAPAQELPSPQPQTAKLKLVVLAGDGAINNIRQRVAREPIVQAQDENDRPIAGALITFTTPGNGPGATFANGSRFATAITDSEGRAAAAGLRPSGGNGSYEIRVTASYRGQTARAAIHQSNAGFGAAVAGVSAKWLILLAGGGAIAGGVFAAAHGGSGQRADASPIPAGPARPAPTIIIPGNPSIGPPR